MLGPGRGERPWARNWYRTAVFIKCAHARNLVALWSNAQPKPLSRDCPRKVEAFENVVWTVGHKKIRPLQTVPGKRDLIWTQGQHVWWDHCWEKSQRASTLWYCRGKRDLVWTRGIIHAWLLYGISFARVVEVSCPNIFSSASRKSSGFGRILLAFCPKMAIWKILGGLQPLAPALYVYASRLQYSAFNFFHVELREHAIWS